ncbi:MAG TPA: lipid-binding SYLF domain-containing protein [Noviherbaspirillum sp.]|nr:lipid-binding SYLF domain-containing protein [Noviherbaspirillum sp.]
MNTEKYKMRVIATACLLAITSLGSVAVAQSTSSSGSSDTQASASTRDSDSKAAATKHVNDAVAVVRRMEAEPGMNNLLQQAKGVFIVPTYGRAALGVGASGGAGVLLAKQDDGTWSDPAFYNLGGINIGAQIGAEGGQIAMILNNDKAVNSFMQKNNFSLNADAGLTVVDWTRVAQGSAGTGDVVAWSGTKGLFGNVASIGVNDIRFNQNQTNAYYGQTVAVNDVISGKVKNPQANTLKQALAATSTGTASGTSGTRPSTGAGGTSGESDSTGTSDTKK